MNKVILMGRLVRDPETRQSNGANPIVITKYTLAVDRRGVKKEQGNNQPTADYINCIAFGKAGEFAEKYFTKGLRILVSGRLQTGSYTNKDGQKVYTTDVFIEEQEFADRRNGSVGSNQQQSRPEQASSVGEGFMNIPSDVDDETLPFN